MVFDKQRGICPNELARNGLGIESGNRQFGGQGGHQALPMGVDWVEDSLSGPRKFVSIALHENSGFGLDSAGCLWLNNGVTEANPFGVGCWYQICSFNLQNMPLDSMGKAGVFINVGRVILAARQPLTGHLLSKVVPYRLSIHDNFSVISAGSFCGDSNDSIFVSQQLNSEIFSFSVKKRNFTSLPPFSESGTVMALSACRERLYLLDSCGRIHFRENVSNNRLSADLTNSTALQPKRGWTNFCEDEIRTSVISLAASNTCIWAIDSFYRIFYVSLSTPSKWTEVDRPKELPNEKIDQIRASSSGKYVWLFASKSGYSWARTEVTETKPKGKSWVQACSDVRVEELAVAENAVWCLARETRQLHRLRSLNINNPAGHYWKPMSFSLKAVSVDAIENRCVGLDMDNRLCKYIHHSVWVRNQQRLQKKLFTMPGVKARKFMSCAKKKTYKDYLLILYIPGA
uniref:Uncharacterized protein n=1 Tax=Ditylenchus dipsaci TaxID=166011 RepID=A0A915CKN1_9BILA